MQYYTEDLSEDSTRIDIVEGDAHHLTNVKRVKIDERVKIFNGKGLQATVVVESIEKKKVSTKVIELVKSARPKVEVVLNFVPPKGKNLSLLIEKSVEVGVDKIVPMSSERSVRFYQDEKSAKLRKIILEACKQSERAWLPEMLPLVGFKERVEGVDVNGGLSLILHPRGGATMLDCFKDKEGLSTVHLFIGPEGGWSDVEISLAEEKGLLLTTMSCPVMRVETAVIASISVIRSICT